MVKELLITVLLMGNSQTAGQMGVLLEQHYQDHGVQVQREAAVGKGVHYFLRATRPGRDTSLLDEETIVGYMQSERIKDILDKGVDYIIFPSLGGNDAYEGCCDKPYKRKWMTHWYRKLFKQLCSYNAIVIFNGSPPADTKKWPKFDRRRAALDKIQDAAARGTCVIRNSTRSMHIPPDRDGYHYNRSARMYVNHLMGLRGMELPIIEAAGD